MRVKLIMLMSMVLLTGCAQMNGQFDCPAGSGVSCTSMKEVDRMASQGMFADNYGHSSKRVAISNRNTLSLQAPSRISENVLKVWFAPFVDSDDNYHQENEIHSVVDKGFWQGNPVQSIKGASS